MPVCLHSVQHLFKQAGDIHRLHSDAESNTIECSRNNATRVWLMLASKCTHQSSPLTLVSGSHNNLTAQEELIKQQCWLRSLRSELPCNVTCILKEVVASDETLTIVVEPRHHLMGIAWPATAWHMTKDTCTREAVSIRYTALISCAQSLTYNSQGKKTRTVHHFARQGSLPPAWWA